MRSCYKIHIFGFMSQHLCVSGSFARSMSLDSCLSIHVYLRVLCKIHAAGFIAQQPYVSQDPLQDPCLRFMSQHLYTSGSLQDPCLRIHVSASSNRRLLCKIHVSGSVYKHPEVGNSQDPLQDLSPDSCLSIHMYLRNLCKICLRIHVSASICISGTSARSMSPDPDISIHMYLRILCEIHVSGFMSQHPHVSQEPLQDPCLRLRMYLRILCKIHVSDSCLSIFISQGPLQDPCLRIHVSASSSLRILCKIHVSDSCLSIHVSASIYISGSSARSMSPESQHLRISGFSTRSMSSDSCLSIH